MSDTAADEQSIFAVFEIAGVEFFALQQLGAVETHVLQFVLQFFRIEEELEGLAVPGHSFGEGGESLALSGIEERGIDGKIEDYAAAGGHFCDEG